ncbi:MAG: response regulator transcription factor [Verrucomicrobia subdivision 3 bacterium]|nr:response regulator transcription factor [Limisphaerales bacterium]
MKVMIVDDNAEMRALIRSLLRGVATDVFECGDGAAAVSAYASKQPDWTVMDVMMPRVDGISATRIIKQRFPDSRILIITQHENPRLEETAREAGATAFLSKEQLLELTSILAVPSHDTSTRTLSETDQPL